MYRCRPRPAATELIRACSCGGGGALDPAGHQRCSVIQGESQARTARSARGQDGAGGGTAGRGPPLFAAGFRPRRPTVALRRLISEPGGPAEAERAVDQGLMPADRGVGADLEVGPAQLVFDLLVALLDPVPDPLDPHDLSKARSRVRAVRPRAGRRAWAGWWLGTRSPCPARCPPDMKNCSRGTDRCCAPVTGSAPASAVSVLFRSRGVGSPARYSRNPHRCAKEPNKSSNRAAYPSSGPGAARHGHPADQAKQVVEPTGAAGVAALLEHSRGFVPPVVAVLSGATSTRCCCPSCSGTV